MRMGGGCWAAGAGVLLLICACDRGTTAEAPARQAEITEAHTGDAEQHATKPPLARDTVQEGLLIGEYGLGDDPVVDGDTIRVDGIEGSLRLLAIDTEEKLRGKGDRAALTRQVAPRVVCGWIPLVGK